MRKVRLQLDRLRNRIWPPGLPRDRLEDDRYRKALEQERRHAAAARLRVMRELKELEQAAEDLREP